MTTNRPQSNLGLATPLLFKSVLNRAMSVGYPLIAYVNTDPELTKTNAEAGCSPSNQCIDGQKSGDRLLVEGYQEDFPPVKQRAFEGVPLLQCLRDAVAIIAPLTRRKDMARAYKYISGDSHLQIPPDMWVHWLPEKYRGWAPQRVQFPEGGDAIYGPGGQIYFAGTGSYAGHTPENYNPMDLITYEGTPGSGGPEQRLKEQDADSLDAEVLYVGSPTLQINGIPDPVIFQAMVRAYNDYVGQEYCAFAPDRLFGVGVLPRKGSIDDRIAEMEHCKKIGIKAVALSGYPSGKRFPTAADDKFWSAALDLDMPLTIHTTLGVGGRSGEPIFEYPKKPSGPIPPDDFLNRLYRHSSSHCGGLEACQMTIAGLFERFPKLRIYWAENNAGWIPYYLEQMDAEWEKNRHWAERDFGVVPLKRRPSEYIKEHAYWGFYDDRVGILNRDLVGGTDHLMWGSDFPHVPTYWPNSIEFLDEQLEGVAVGEQHQMVAKNILDFLHIDS